MSGEMRRRFPSGEIPVGKFSLGLSGPAAALVGCDGHLTVAGDGARGRDGVETESDSVTISAGSEF
jgi:hypothetical protein